MLSASEFREVVSGRRRGAAAGVMRAALWLAEVPYAMAVRWRNRRYDTQPRLTHCVDAPVVSVGNLTLGGTGKTPMVEWIARWFHGRDVRAAVVSRGYGAAAGAENDEALELKQKLPEVPQVQNADRVAGARAAIERFGCRAIVLDDAFQHRRIGRDLDVVLLDALEPFGFEHVFPRGMLREPVEGLRRAQIVVLSRADVLEPAQREEIRRRVERLAPEALWAEVAHAPRALLACDGREEPLESPELLRGKPVAAFCGVGNPAGFRHTLERCGYQVAAFREFADHHAYGPADVRALDQWAGRLDVQAVVCTQKDLVKLSVDQLGGHPLRAVRIGVEFLRGQAELEKRLEALLPAAGAHD